MNLFHSDKMNLNYTVIYLHVLIIALIFLRFLPQNNNLESTSCTKEMI